MKLLSRDSLLSIPIYIAVFLFSIYPYADPDWGWHYRYGEYFIRHGKLLLANPYSWVLPNYHWINPSWIYDEVVYFLYRYGNFAVFSVAGGLVALLIFFILLKPFALKYWQKGILAFFYVVIISRTMHDGLRSQMFASIFLSILMTLIYFLESRPALLFALPVLFFVWANVHGLFTVGLAILGIYIAVDALSRKRLNLKLVAALGVSTAVTLLNPFTYHLHLEVFKHWQNPALLHIFEWDPIRTNICSTTGNVCSAFYSYSFAITIAAFTIIAMTRKPLYIFYALAGLLLFAMTQNAERYLVQFVIVTLPLAAMTMSRWSTFFDRYKSVHVISAITIVGLLYFGAFVRLPPYHLSQYTFEEYCIRSVCPEKAIQFMTQNPPAGNGFTFYDWGGYIIGRGAPFQTFVDGRMTVWNEKNTNPFMDFIDIYYNNNLDLFRKYSFQWILVPRDSSLIDRLLMAKPEENLGTWMIRYVDPEATYLSRIH